jgi:hypothetical protein
LTEDRHGRIGRRQLTIISTGFIWKREQVEGVSIKRARACCLAQAWGKYREIWWKSTWKVTGWENVLVGH